VLFRNRLDAGKRLAEALSEYKGKNAVIYALPRGGVVLGAEVARELHGELDLIVVRKIGHPQAPEYAIGAVSADGHHVQNTAEILGVGEAWFKQACKSQQEEARRRYELFLGRRQPVSAKGRIAIIVDDGLATGLTMSLAIREARHRSPAAVIVAVPVAAPEAIAELKRHVDGIVVLYVPDNLGAIGAFYEDFTQVTDEEVVRLMDNTAERTF
jgi:predicted phosphoribosyltransferase